MESYVYDKISLVNGTNIFDRVNGLGQSLGRNQPNIHALTPHGHTLQKRVVATRALKSDQ